MNSKKETNGRVKMGQDGLLWLKSAIETVRLGQKELACAWVKLGLARFAKESIWVERHECCTFKTHHALYLTNRQYQTIQSKQKIFGYLNHIFLTLCLRIPSNLYNFYSTIILLLIGRNFCMILIMSLLMIKHVVNTLLKWYGIVRIISRNGTVRKNIYFVLQMMCLPRRFFNYFTTASCQPMSIAFN